MSFSLFSYCSLEYWNIPSFSAWKCVIWEPTAFIVSLLSLFCSFFSAKLWWGLLQVREGRRHSPEATDYILWGLKIILQVIEFVLVLMRFDHLLSKDRGGEELTFTAAFLDCSAFADRSPEMQTLYSSQLFSDGKQNHTYFQYTLASIQGFQKQSLNQFMLWYHTKHGVNISGQMVSPLSEFTLFRIHITWRLPLEHAALPWFSSTPCILSFLSP